MAKILTITKNPKLKPHPEDTFPTICIEVGAHRTATAPTTTLASGNAVGYLFTPTVTKDLAGFAIAVSNQSGTPSPIGELYAVAGGEPTGSPLATTTTAVSLGTTGSFVTFTFTDVYEVQAGVQYCIVLQPTGGSGTSYTAYGADLISADGWGIIYTTSIQATIADTVWRWKKGFAPPLHLNYSDTTQECAVPAQGGGTSNSGAIHLFGDPNGGSGRFQGICIRPDFDFNLKQVGVSCRYSGTAGTANEIELRVYEVADGTLTIINGPWTSSNTIDAENDLGSATSNTFTIVDFVPSVNLERNHTYVIVACQTGNGGTSTDSHDYNLDGFGGASYVGFPPETNAQNVVHGIYGVSSTAGINALAFYGSHFPFMQLFGIPYVR